MANGELDAITLTLSKAYTRKYQSIGIIDAVAVPMGIEFTLADGTKDTISIDDWGYREKSFEITDWVKDALIEDKYTLEFVHNLETKSVLAIVYDEFDKSAFVEINTNDINKVVVDSIEPFKGRLVIGYAGANGTGGIDLSIYDTKIGVDNKILNHTSNKNNPHEVKLSQALDVSLNTPNTKHVPTYDTTSTKWVNKDVNTLLDNATETTYGTVKYGSSTPLADSFTPTKGISEKVSREDHVHPIVLDEYLNIEVLTNKIWMGRPIYRKCIDLGNLPDTNYTSKTVPHGLTNVFFTEVTGWFYGNDHWGHIPYSSTRTIDNIRFYATPVDLYIEVARDRSMYIAYAVLEYYKL